LAPELSIAMAEFMVWGRWTYAVGGEPEAAVEMGTRHRC